MHIFLQSGGRGASWARLVATRRGLIVWRVVGTGKAASWKSEVSTSWSALTLAYEQVYLERGGAGDRWV